MIQAFMHDPQLGIAMFCMVILAISVHEMAHAWAALKCGDDTAAHLGRLTINPAAHFDPFGLMMIIFVGFGWGKPVPVDIRYLRKPTRDMMLIAAAGPASNFVQAAILAILFRIITIPFIGETIYSFPYGEDIFHACILVLEIGVYFNFILAFFNLIPLFPLDGDKILAGLLPYRQARAFDEFRQHSTMILVGLLMLDFMTPFRIIGTYLQLTAGPMTWLFLGFNPFNLY